MEKEIIHQLNMITSKFRKYTAVICSATVISMAPFVFYSYHVAVDRNFEMRWIDYFMLTLFFGLMIYMFIFVYLRIGVIKIYDNKIELNQYLIRKKSIDFKNISKIKKTTLWTTLQLKDFKELKMYDSSGKLWFIISEYSYSNYHKIVPIIIEKVNIQPL